jgi:hypothetical protein
MTVKELRERERKGEGDWIALIIEPWRKPRYI